MISERLGLMLNVNELVEKGLFEEKLLTDNEQLIFASGFLESIVEMQG